MHQYSTHQWPHLSTHNAKHKLTSQSDTVSHITTRSQVRGARITVKVRVIMCLGLIMTMMQLTQQSVFVNMDIDIEQGDYMVNSQCVYAFQVITDTVQGGTAIKIQVPMQLTTIATSGSTIGFCKEAVFFNNGTFYEKALTNCIYQEYIGYGAITTAISATYTDIVAYYIKVGYIKNPFSVQDTDSFVISLSGGSPTTTFNTGLTLNYIPNKIYSATLTNSLVQAGTSDTYVFKFKITNNIIQRGYIQIVFPNQYTQVPSNIGSITSINVYGTAKTSFSTTTPTQRTVTYAGLFDLAQLTADATKFITITLTGITNPSSIITTDSFQITTYDDQMQAIDQITTGLTIAITQPGTITVNSVTVASQSVDAFTLLQFTVTPSAIFTTGGYIEVTSQSSLVTTPSSASQVTCSGTLGFTGSTTCSRVNSTTIRITRNPSNGMLVTLFQMTFMVASFRNTLGVLQQAPFFIFFKQSDGTLVAMTNSAASYMTVANALTISSAVRSSSVTTVGLTGAQYTISFTTQTRLPTVGQIVITLPAEQVAYSASMTCADGSGNNLGCVLTQGTNLFNVTIPANKFCASECASGSSFTIVMNNARNPSYINSPLTESVKVYTMNLISSTYYVIDQVVASVFFTNSLTPGALTAMALTRTGSSLTGGIPIYTFSFTTATVLPSGAVFILTYPTATGYLGTATVTCTVGGSSRTCVATGDSTDSTILKTVTISNGCSSTTCAAGTTYSVIITNFYNPFSTAPNTNVAFTIQTQVSATNGLVDRSSFNAAQLSLSPNALTVTLTAPVSPIVVGDIADYTLTIVNPVNKIPSSTNQGSLVITFPNEVILQSNACSAQTSSLALTCTASTTTQSVTVTSPSDLPKSTTITVSLVNNVKNPPTGAASSAFQITTFFQTYSIETSTTTKVTADTFNKITNFFSTRSVVTVNTASPFTISFQTTNPIPPNSRISFSIPTDQALIDSSTTFSATDLSGSGTVTVLTTLAGPTSGYITFTLREFCSDDNGGTSCPPTFTSSVRLSGLKNPLNARFPSNSIIIQIFTSTGDKIDAVSTSFFTTPQCNYGALTSVLISRTVHTVGQTTAYTFRFQTNSNGDLGTQGNVTIQFPASFIFDMSSGNPTCTVRDASSASNSAVSTTCFATKVADSNNMGNYISRLTANLQCATIGCGGSATLEFTFTGYLNQFNTQPRAGSYISTSTTTGSGTTYEIKNVLDQLLGTDIPLSQLPNFTPGTIVATQLVRTVLFADANTIIQYTLTLPTKTQKNSLIQIAVPSTQFVPSGQNYQFQYYSGSSYGTAATLTLISATGTMTNVQMKESCSGTGNFCAGGTSYRFQFNQGFKNVGSVQTPTNFFTITTYTPDGSYIIDTVTDVSATPSVIPALMTISSITFSQPYAAFSGVNVDITLKFGATVSAGNYLDLTFSAEFIRNDAGDITCATVASSVETAATCITTQTNNVVNLISITNICPSGCTGTSTNVIRLKNVVNILSAAAFTGNLLAEAKVSATSVISSVTYALSSVTTLSPGPLNSVTIVRSKTTQGAVADYTMTWKIPGYLMTSSNVLIKFPLNQITINTGSAYTFKSGTTTLTFSAASGSPTSTYNIFSGSQWQCTTICSAGAIFTLTVSNAANPFIQSTTYDDFVIQHQTLTGTLIFQSPSPLLATPDLAFGVIDNIGIVHQNQPYVGTSTQYQFTFTVEDDIPINGKLRFTFPPNRVLQFTSSTLVCTVGGVTYPCTITYVQTTGTQVIIPGLCTTAKCVAPITYTVLLAGAMRNPSSVPSDTSGNFVIETLTSNNYIVSQGKVANSDVANIQPQPVDIKVNRTSPYLGIVNDYTVTFTTVNAIPANGFIRIIYPLDQVNVPTNGPGCKVNFVLTTLTCSVVFRPTGFIWVDIKSPCGTSACAAPYSMELLFTNMQNPSTFSANDATSSFQVYTMNAAKEYIDGVGTGLKALPALVGKTAIIQAMELTDDVVQRSNYLSLLIIPGYAFDKTAIFDIYFPDQFALYDGSNTCRVVIGTNIANPCTFTSYTSGHIKKVSMTNPCPYTCDAMGIYLYQIPIKNRIDNYAAGGQFMIIGRYTDIDVSQGTILNSLTFDTDFISDFYVYNDGSDTIEQDAQLFITFKPVNFLPTKANKGRIRIVLPSEVKSFSSNCLSNIDLNPSFSSCTTSGQTIYVYHTIATTVVGKNITIKIPQVINPSSTKPSSPIRVYTEDDSQGTGTYYQIDVNIINITYKVNTCTEFKSVKVTRASMNNGQGYQTGMATQLQFQILLRHALVPTSSFIIQFPEAAQLNISQTTTMSTCYSTDAQGKNQNLLLCQLVRSNRTIIVRNYCQVSSCVSGRSVYFKMYDDFVLNYAYVVDPLDSTRDSLLIRSTTAEGYYYLDETKKSVFVKPDLVPADLIMPSPEIIRTNNVINKRVQWVFNFQTNINYLPKGSYVLITIPQNVLLTIRNSSVDIYNYDNGKLYTNANVSLYSDGLSVQYINLTNFCNTTAGCKVGSAYSILVDWVRNPLSQLGTYQSSVTIETFNNLSYAAELGKTPQVYQLFSELIPVAIENLFVRIANPVPSVITSYTFTFSADAEFNKSDILVITFPDGVIPTPNVTATGRMLQSTSKCLAPLTPYVKLNCTASGQVVVIRGLYVNGNQQYSVQINTVLNPPTPQTTKSFVLEVQNYRNLTIAARSTNAQIDIYQPIANQQSCNQVCGSCAGTTATCTSCKNPSKYPIFRNYQCVDDCAAGWFFDETTLQCLKCHHGCSECSGAGNNQCLGCAENYFLQDGICVPYCIKGLVEDKTLRQCRQSNSTLCSPNCETCSFSSNYCLSCRKTSGSPYLDTVSGRCINDDASLCNNTQGDHFYIDKTEMKCKQCNELCQTCESQANVCTSCWSFNLNNKINELYETCVDVCGLGTWYNSKLDMCSFCNSACLTCRGYEADQCLVCNKTPEARQLFLYEDQCVIECPKKYYVNEITNECVEGQAQILSFSFLFMFFTVFCGVTVILASIIITKRKNKTIDVTFAVMSCVESLNRLVLLGNMWFKSNVFALAVCFMNLIATCAIAVFFNFLFMTPIFAHSPLYRQIYKKHTLAFQSVTCISYFSGVNVMRLLCSKFLGIEGLTSNLNEQKFFFVPLNTMGNFTLAFNVCQFAVNIFVLMTLTISDDAFVLSILGAFLNIFLIIFQISKHLNVKTTLARMS